MPIYDYVCPKCGNKIEVISAIDGKKPDCCGEVMTRHFSGSFLIRIGYPGWIDKIDDIHKAQEQKGERFRFVHPREVRAT